MFSGADAYFRLRPDGSAYLKHGTILTDAGGTVNGGIRQSVGDIIAASRDDMWTSIKGGSGHDHGATLILYGQDHSGGAGCANLQAYKTGVGATTFAVWPDGSVYVNDNHVLTSAGGITSWLTIQNKQTNEAGYLYAADKTFFVGGRGADGRDSAFIRFYYLDEPRDPGAFMVSTRAANGNWGPGLFGSPNGDLWWNNAYVLTSAGGTMTGSLLVSNILSGDNDGFGLYGGNTWRTGGYIELGGPNHTYPNHIQIKGGSRQVLEDLGGGWYIGGSPIVTLKSSWRSGNDWYRKYSDGWIEQGGEIWVSGVATHTIPLNTPFSHTVYTVVASQAVLGSSGGEWVNGQSITERATTSFKVYDVHSGGHTILWYACGN